MDVVHFCRIIRSTRSSFVCLKKFADYDFDFQVECAEVEKEGVVLEKRLRERGEGEQGEFMAHWYR